MKYLPQCISCRKRFGTNDPLGQVCPSCRERAARKFEGQQFDREVRRQQREAWGKTTESDDQEISGDWES